MNLCELNAKKERRQDPRIISSTNKEEDGYILGFSLCDLSLQHGKVALASSSNHLGLWQQLEFLQQTLMENHPHALCLRKKDDGPLREMENMIFDRRGKNKTSIRFRKSHLSSHLSLIIIQVIHKVLKGCKWSSTCKSQN